MNNYLQYLLAFAVAVAILAALVMSIVHINSQQKISVYIGEQCAIPQEVKNLGLLGCTPHPTHYIVQNKSSMQDLAKITINDFLDVPYVYDSFVKTFNLCNEHAIDHLLIAYLPIYYVGMRQLFKEQFVVACRVFLTAIVGDIQSLITKAADETNYHGTITLILPTNNQLEKVPVEIKSLDDRFRYLVKQFPHLAGISKSNLETITIINNKESAEDAALISYFKYEYLFEKPIAFTALYINKERFHK